MIEEIYYFLLIQSKFIKHFNRTLHKILQIIVLLFIGNDIKRTFNDIIKTIVHIFLGLILFIIFNFTIASILLNSYSNESANSSFLHEKYLGTINRAQQVYFLEHSSFLDNSSNYRVLFGDAKYIKENSSSNYHYFIEVQENLAFIYAITLKKYDPKIFLGINLG